MVMLEVRQLTKHFGGVSALVDVSFHIDAGQIVGLIGPNGAGKTTLFNCITGLLPPDHGHIRFRRMMSSSSYPPSAPKSRGVEHLSLYPSENPVSLIGLRADQIAKLGIVRTFQNIRLFSGMSVLENVLVGTYLRTRAGSWQAILASVAARREEQWAYERAMSLLEWMDLEGYADHLAKVLPFGLQRRLEIARALACEPSLLLLDEPAAGLNPVEKRQLLSLIAQLKSRGLTILLIEHDMQVVMLISEHVVVLDHGRQIAEGSPLEIQANPKVIAAYLGSHHQA